jgi:murein DD-endopeptidase MepM/ murein hydrolase activator NlpD
MLSLSAIVLVGAVNLMAPTTQKLAQASRELPVESGRVTSSYGRRIDPFNKKSRFHEGLDIAAPYGSVIRPVAPGIVVFTGRYEGFGNLVVVKHGNDLTSHYAHCWGVKVKVGQLVTKATPLGFVGSSGRATGPHLHLEVRFKGASVDPLWILSK